MRASSWVVLATVLGLCAGQDGGHVMSEEDKNAYNLAAEAEVNAAAAAAAAMPGEEASHGVGVDNHSLDGWMGDSVCQEVERWPDVIVNEQMKAPRDIAMVSQRAGQGGEGGERGEGWQVLAHTTATTPPRHDATSPPSPPTHQTYHHSPLTTPPPMQPHTIHYGSKHIAIH